MPPWHIQEADQQNEKEANSESVLRKLGNRLDSLNMS